MYLMRLIYVSNFSDELTEKEVASIIESCRKNNPAVNITGVLCYNNNYFLQCIEGSRLEVNRLYQRILKDPRHHDPTILQYQHINQRDFGQWAMGYIPPAKISGEIIAKYSGEKVFKPYSMEGESCHLLLKELFLSGIAR